MYIFAPPDEFRGQFLTASLKLTFDGKSVLPNQRMLTVYGNKEKINQKPGTSTTTTPPSTNMEFDDLLQAVATKNYT